MPEKSTSNFKALLLKVAAGDEQAFAQLFKAYHNQLGDFIMRLTESEPLTQEIVQDVFLKIWNHRIVLAEVNCFKAYLFVVARNHAFNCLKQIARERSRNKEWVKAILYQASMNSEDTIAQPAEDLIEEAIELLPPQQKKVYTLSRRYGMKHVDIARELNISRETVKKHMVLALHCLKNHLRTRINLLIILVASLFN